MNENVLDIDKAALVDGDTITVNNGKLTGTNYHFGNGFHTDSQIGSATVNLDLKTDEDLSWNQSTATISSKITADGSTIVKQGSTLKGNYQAGQNISITGNTISANIPDVKVSSGSGVTVSGSSKSGYVISAQGTEISGGEGIICVGSPLTGYTISSIQPYKKKKEDDDPEEKNEDSEPSGESDPLTASSAPSTVSLVGPLGAALGAASSLIGAAPAAGAVASASSAFGAIGALAGAAGGVAVLGGLLQESGRRRQNKTNSDGTNIIGADGNPVLVDGSEVIIATFPKINDTDCDVTRLMFDKPPPCSWRGVAKEFGQQSVNLDILNEWNDEINAPAYMSVIANNTSLLQTALDTKFNKTGILPYSQLSNTPDLSVYQKILSATSPLSIANSVISLNSNLITSLGTLTSLNVTGALTAGSISSPTLNNYLLSSVASTTYQPLNARLTNFGNIAPTNTYMLIASGGNFIQYSPADVRANLSLKNLSLLDTLDYTSSALVNKPTLGSLAALSSIDYASTYITGKPTLGSLAALSSIDYTSALLTNKPSLGSLAALSSVDYTSALLTNKPTLGSLAALSSIDYASALLTNKPTLGSLAAKSVINLGSADVTGILSVANIDPNIVLAGTGLTKTAQTLSVNPVQTQITSVGTLTGLTVSGSSTFTGSITVPTPTTASHAVTKSYVDGLISTTQTGAQPLNGKLTAISSSTATLNNFLVGDGTNYISTTPSASRTALGLGSIALKNFIDLANDVGTTVLPYANIDGTVALKSYVDGLVSTAGTGLTKTGNIFSVNASQTGITSLGTLSSLSVGGNANLSNVQIAGTTDSTSTTSGALQVVGGVGVGKSVVVGGTVFLGGTTANLNTTTGQTLNINNAASTVVTSTLDSNAINAGSLQVAGGVGIAKSLYVGGYGIIKESTAGNGPSVGLINSNGGGWTLWHIGQTSGLGTNNFGLYNNTAANLALSVNVTTNALTINSVSDSNATNTGALQVAGGVGIAKKLTVGSDASFVGSNQSLFWYNGSVSTPTFGSSITGNVSAAGYFSSNSAIGDMVIRAQYNNSPTNLRFANSPGVSNLDILTNGNVLINTTTDSSSTTTGALTVAGGLGVGKSLFAGSAATGSHTLQVNSTSVDILKLQSLSASGFSTIGFLNNTGTVVGAFGYAGVNTTAPNAGNFFLYSGSNANFIINSNLPSVQILSTIDSTTTTSGSLQVRGGAGIAGNVNIGKDLTVNGTIYSNIASTGPIVSSHLGTPNLAAGSFSTLQIGVGAATNNMARLYFNYAGAGLATNTLGLGLWNSPQGLTVDGTGKVFIPNGSIGSLTVSGNMNFTGNLSTITSTGQGPFSIDPNNSTNPYVRVWDDLRTVGDFSVWNSAETTTWFKVFTNNGVASVFTTTDSTGVGSGALQVNGGASVAKNVYVGGNVSVLNTSDATSNTSGALQVNGGASVAKSLYVGSNLNISGDLKSPALNSVTTLIPYPTTPATGSSWNGYTVTASSEYTYANGNGVDGYTGHPFDAYMNASIASRLRWQTSSTSTANLGLDGTTQSLHYSLLRLPSSVAMSSIKLTAYLPDGVLMPTTFSVIAGTVESTMVTIATFSNIPASSWVIDVWGCAWAYANQTTAGGVAIRQIQYNQAVPKATLVSASANNIDISDGVNDVLLTNTNGYTGGFGPIGWKVGMSAVFSSAVALFFDEYATFRSDNYTDKYHPLEQLLEFLDAMLLSINIKNARSMVFIPALKNEIFTETIILLGKNSTIEVCYEKMNYNNSLDTLDIWHFDKRWRVKIGKVTGMA
ncbi:uncharacterized protein EV422DRAFT_505509 [Fimicolochytrium jonesii]|uniref:uncharacterized protein n=1 Tax=Fimicolochytrium jonesii TaxID=1396493 RepID=UPI0022FEE330|nr:uncharacterized protein EV422DRAFT_505509 [Fimicolochytrium jonesii]KAI8821998.1 hypothetical protein EV422DRAFT_505509 [Fimicolochytrium jonesii]